MVKRFHGDANASFYTGLLISSFSLSEAITSIFWGSLSDRIGRKPVLLLGCLGTLISMLMVGVATNFWFALLGRALGGILNGNIAVIQTMVGELVRKPEHEPRAYAVMPFVWSIGTIIGPSIGGLLADPSVSMPSYFSADGIFASFPYLLPNLLCASLLFISTVAGYFWLHETHPDMQPWSTQAAVDNQSSETTLIKNADLTTNSEVDTQPASYGTFHHVDNNGTGQWLAKSDWSDRRGSTSSVPQSSQTRQKVFTRRVLMLVVALSIFAYHQMSYDHLLPIFFQDPPASSPSTLFSNPGGLGLSTRTVGIIMSINGISALVIQGVIFPLAAQWLGVWRLFTLVTIFQPILYFIVPLLPLLPAQYLFEGIYACLTIRNLFSILGYPVLLILLKEACPKPSVLGKVNGLAASAAAACRTIAPPVSGWLYGVGAQIGWTGLAWWGSGAMALTGILQLYWVEKETRPTATGRLSFAEMEESSKIEAVRISVREVDEV